MSQFLSTSHIISFSSQNTQEIGTLFSLHFIDKGNVVEEITGTRLILSEIG